MNSSTKAVKPLAVAFLLIAAVPTALSIEAGTANENARSLMNVDPVHESGFTGKGSTAAMWGFGLAGDHTDLESDNGLVQVDSGEVSGHPTHVAGTVSGQGIKDSSKKGFAPDSRMLSYTLETSSTDRLVSETLDAQSRGAVVSHNSWAWISRDRHGDYDSFSRTYDKLVRGTASGQEEGISVVFPSANHRNDVDRDYNTIPGTGSTAKNSITVGAVDGQADMTSFSSWGPTDSGRLKPDLVANGQFVESTLPGGNYGYKRGTSVAAPAVSGAVVLLNDVYDEETGTRPDPATVKAVLIHNAEDLEREGPDYKTGWGVPDVEKSVQQVQKDQSANVIQTGKLAYQGQADSYSSDFSGRGESKITLVWSDKAGSNGELVNDLDLQVKDSSGKELESWRLDSSNPKDAATKGEDHTNTVEQVEIPDSTGEVQISVESDYLEDGQSYSLVSDSEILEEKEETTEDETQEDTGTDTDGPDEETTEGSTGDEDYSDSGEINTELDIVSPVKKTYRTDKIDFTASTEDLSQVTMDLNGESYSLERQDSDSFSKEISVKDGFQTATFRAEADNGDRLESSIFFYAITGSDSDEDSGSGTQDPEKDTDDKESDTDTGSDDSVDEDTDTSTDDTGTVDEEETTGSDDSSSEEDSETSDSTDSTDLEDTDNTETSDEEGPEIEIISPEAGQEFDGKTQFKVKYSEEVSSAQLTLNRKKTYDLEKNGDYYTGEYSLVEGLNTMMFMGTDTSGNFNSETLTVRN